jgi:hypothetical protein
MAKKKESGPTPLEVKHITTFQVGMIHLQYVDTFHGGTIIIENTGLCNVSYGIKEYPNKVLAPGESVKSSEQVWYIASSIGEITVKFF